MLFDLNRLSVSFMNYELTGWMALLLYAVCAALVALAGRILATAVRKKFFPFLLERGAAQRVPALGVLLRGFSSPLPFLIETGTLCIAICLLPWRPTVVVRTAVLLFRLLAIFEVMLGLLRSSDLCVMFIADTQKTLQLETNRTITSFFSNAYRIVVGSLGTIAILTELGIDVSALVAGVGLVGLTVSLAAQSSAANLFSGIVILLENPFSVGDWITVNDISGTVEDINFRSTRIRALDNSLYVLPNSAVCDATINNGTNRTKRLYRFTLGVTYTSSRQQIQQLMADLEEMLRAQPMVDPASVFVRLTGFGSSSIDILINAYILTKDMGVFLSEQNRLNLLLMEVMERNNMSFAFPSTSVYVETLPALQQHRAPDDAF